MIKKIKKIVVSTVVLMGTVLNRAYGVPPPDPAYGIERPEPKFDLLEELFKLAKYIAIPIVFIVGSFIYYKKSKSSKIIKFLTILIALVLLGVLYYLLITL